MSYPGAGRDVLQFRSGIRQVPDECGSSGKRNPAVSRRGPGTGAQIDGGSTMDFYAVLDQSLELLRQRGRVTYNALKRQFDLDDACLQDLKDEIIEAQRVAVDEDGRVLVWTGNLAATPPPASEPVSVQPRQPDAGPQAYTPAH